ncbi:MAG: hypothetical protein JO042_04940 [Sinobacteraceae bacterium]|nr:hypothetical protein [Nevskiaceae bacterium]
MRREVVITAALLAPMTVSHAAPSTVDDRIALSGNGTVQTNTGGGGGASAAWLHNFDSDTLFGLAAEHEKLDVSHWNFGTLNGAVTRGPGDARYTLYGDARAGSGVDGRKHFKYLVGTLGVTGTYFHRLSVTLEDKQFNIETTHGNLPKLQAAYLWNPHLQTTLAYAYSFGGNLGTRLTTARVDTYFKPVNVFAGGGIGQASPSVLGLGFTAPPEHLKEGYVGATKTIPQWRSELTLIVDYQHLSGGTGTTTKVDPFTGLPLTSGYIIPASRRWTATLNYMFHIGHNGT